MRLALIFLFALVTVTRADVVFDTGIRQLPKNQATFQPVLGSDFGTDSVVYQSFNVDADQRWNLERVEVFTQTFESVNRTVRFTIARQGSSLEPGTVVAESTADVMLQDRLDPGVWSSIDFDGTSLDSGTYLLIAQYTQPDTAVWWHHGATGTNAVMGVDLGSRWLEAAHPVALRIYGSVVPSPAVMPAFLALWLMRKRPSR